MTHSDTHGGWPASGTGPARAYQDLGIRRATLADLDQLCVTQNRSFVDDPITRFLYGEAGAAPSALRYLFRRWIRFAEVWTTPEVTSFAAWVPPGCKLGDLPHQDADGPEPSGELGAKLEALDNAVHAHLPTMPHWYLNMVGTHPDWQGRGLAKKLISPMLDHASATGVGCYLETETPNNVALYERLGFHVQSEWTVAGGPVMWGMWRKPV